jgi:hypothetical protein
VLSCIYTSSKGANSESKETHLSNTWGLEPCQDDWGRGCINQCNFLSKHNVMETHLHQSDQGATAISPNNGAFLLNMKMPIVSFSLVIRDYTNSFKTGVFHVNIFNTDAHKSPHMQNLIGSLQGINYLEFISDIAAGDEKNKEGEKANVV